MEAQSIATRRHLAGPTSLPHYSLPPPSSSDIPSTRNSHYFSSAMPNPSGSHQGTERGIPPLTNGGPRGAPSDSLSSPAVPSSPFTTTSAASTNILTHPTSGAMPDGIGPPPSNGGGNSSQSPGGQSYYAPHGSWSTPGSSQQPGYAYSNPAPQGPSFPHRSYQNGLASPSVQQFSRSSPTAPNGENLSNTSYQDQQQSFPSPVPGGSNGGSGSGGGAGGAPILGSSQPSGLAQPMMNGSAPPGPQQPSPAHGHQGVSGQTADNAYGQRPNPGAFYPPGSTPQQNSFPAFAPHPAQQSPTEASPTGSVVSLPPRLAPGVGGLPQAQYPPRQTHGLPSMATYQSYPSVPGPVLSNLHQPGGGLTIINSPYGMPYTQPMYMNHGHHAAHPPHQDRPFRCDQCPQSFNRNHDLKRHKRIHLAVKPFPCLFCEKSFSRKDALKRHKLVKGCGDGEKPDNGDSAEPRADDNSDSAPGDESVNKGTKKAR
ncbi:hypothetical protein QBC44DRAFT_53909 [Cladorrhinum sp. PSN332]|nr:hypothetical protein QBC44DRAFT_53909 [Cladorrhinum sp. PSN332]